MGVGLVVVMLCVKPGRVTTVVVLVIYLLTVGRLETHRIFLVVVVLVLVVALLVEAMVEVM